MTDLSNKVALVTGSARGVGKAIALRYASLGANVVVNYSEDEANATRTVEEVEAFGVEAIAVKADVSKVADLENLFAVAIDRFGKLNIVVANAGIELPLVPLAEATEEQFDRLFGVNTKGAFFTLKFAADHVADNGRILYIGSSTTTAPLPGAGLYGSSKMAVRYLVEVLAIEAGHRGITVNTIIPTVIEGAGIYTDIHEEDPFRQSMAQFRPIGGRMGQAADVADAAEYFASDLAAWVSGQYLLIAGGASQ
ncbi:MAG: short-chain dehydrogenase/reductase [Frondihabitans sp.]|nr:short-chain dehydrogenase/reductase [Frondihabitans sp.]